MYVSDYRFPNSSLPMQRHKLQEVQDAVSVSSSSEEFTVNLQGCSKTLNSNQSHCLPVAIPFDQQVKLFGEWLSVVDIGRFDSAVCKSTACSHFLDLISCNEVHLTEHICFDNGSREIALVDAKEESCMEWILLRGMKIRSFAVPYCKLANSDLRSRLFTHSDRHMMIINLADLSNESQRWLPSDVDEVRK